MKFTTPDGTRDIFAVAGTRLLAEVEIHDGNVGWTSFGELGDYEHLTVDADEWDAFVAMIKEVDEARKAEE